MTTKFTPTQLQVAEELLQTLACRHYRPVLEYLMNYPTADWIDIYINAGMDVQALDHCLTLLNRLGLIHFSQETAFGQSITLDQQRLLTILHTTNGWSKSIQNCSVEI
ncbi:MAG: hypothetical protein H6555_01050 [Lewinellaceae bacterium]|nr:hypothetical protein [Lewinellaceae bacterium]